MKSIFLSIVAAAALWLGGTLTEQADAQYVRYGRGYYATPRYYSGGSYYYGPRYNTYYRPGYYYNQPYYSGYRGYYGRPYSGRPYYGSRSYYGGGYYSRPGVSVGVGPARIGIGF